MSWVVGHRLRIHRREGEQEGGSCSFRGWEGAHWVHPWGWEEDRLGLREEVYQRSPFLRCLVETKEALQCWGQQVVREVQGELRDVQNQPLVGEGVGYLPLEEKSQEEGRRVACSVAMAACLVGMVASLALGAYLVARPSHLRLAGEEGQKH